MAKQKPRERAEGENGDTHTTRKARRPSEELLPGLENIKDRALMAQAKIYADAMFESETALERATKAKQTIRNRMSNVLDAHLFIGHGYEFVRSEGEEKFSARKVKRGSRPEDTVPADEAEAGDEGGEE